MTRDTTRDAAILSLLVICIGSLSFAPNTAASDVYTYKDENGIIVITDQSIPEKYKKQAQKIESYQRKSPKESRSAQADQKKEPPQQDAAGRSNRPQEASGRPTKSMAETCKDRCENYRTSCEQLCAGQEMLAAQKCKDMCKNGYNDCVNTCK